MSFPFLSTTTSQNTCLQTADTYYGLIISQYKLSFLQTGHEETIRVNNREMKFKMLSQIPYIFGKYSLVFKMLEAYCCNLGMPGTNTL